ncbi:hypothetical protein [Tenacibaculum halocynthiae]|uniref:hypothetical protein n=1 Tax=Tenacibaculum halocynthiae TaxID=1254437 RepID=UPI0038939501
MDLDKLLQIRKEIKTIENNPELDSFEKYYELVKLEAELNELIAKQQQQQQQTPELDSLYKKILLLFS